MQFDKRNAKVRTLKDQGSRGWQPGSRNCQWGVIGTIVDRSDAHGACYEVQHPDGTRAWYEVVELALA